MKRHNALVIFSRDYQKGLMLAQLLKLYAPTYQDLPTDLVGGMAYTKESFELEIKKYFEDDKIELSRKEFIKSCKRKSP